MNLKEYSYNSLFKNQFAPKPETIIIHWYSIQVTPDPAPEVTTKSENIIKDESKELQPVFNIVDITPKRSIFRRK